MKPVRMKDVLDLGRGFLLFKRQVMVDLLEMSCKSLEGTHHLTEHIPSVSVSPRVLWAGILSIF